MSGSRWCRTHYVADPERLFATGYLTSVVTHGRPDASPDTSETPRDLIVTEESDEFPRHDVSGPGGSATLADLLERRGTSPQITNGVTQTEEYGSFL